MMPTSEIYYAQLVEEESTATVMAGLQEVLKRKGLSCALYSDRGSHFWLTPKVGGKVDVHRLTQVGRALRELGLQMIPAYSPQARGRSERNFGTWQGRLPQELRLHGITTVEAANRFLQEHYVAEFNTKSSSGCRGQGSGCLWMASTPRAQLTKWGTRASANLTENTAASLASLSCAMSKLFERTVCRRIIPRE
jgi:hypothetical protein